jgi:hypothetical protein
MRRTGRRWEECESMVAKLSNLIGGSNASDIRLNSSDLPTAIVSVLRAVQKASELK